MEKALLISVKFESTLVSFSCQVWSVLSRSCQSKTHEFLDFGKWANNTQELARYMPPLLGVSPFLSGAHPAKQIQPPNERRGSNPKQNLQEGASSIMEGLCKSLQFACRSSKTD